MLGAEVMAGSGHWPSQGRSSFCSANPKEPEWGGGTSLTKYSLPGERVVRPLQAHGELLGSWVSQGGGVESQGPITSTSGAQGQGGGVLACEPERRWWAQPRPASGCEHRLPEGSGGPRCRQVPAASTRMARPSQPSP